MHRWEEKKANEAARIEAEDAAYRAQLLEAERLEGVRREREKEEAEAEARRVKEAAAAWEGRKILNIEKLLCKASTIVSDAKPTTGISWLLAFEANQSMVLEAAQVMLSPGEDEQALLAELAMASAEEERIQAQLEAVEEESLAFVSRRERRENPKYW